MLHSEHLRRVYHYILEQTTLLKDLQTNSTLTMLGWISTESITAVWQILFALQSASLFLIQKRKWHHSLALLTNHLLLELHLRVNRMHLDQALTEGCKAFASRADMFASNTPTVRYYASTAQR